MAGSFPLLTCLRYSSNHFQLADCSSPVGVRTEYMAPYINNGIDKINKPALIPANTCIGVSQPGFSDATVPPTTTQKIKTIIEAIISRKPPMDNQARFC